MIAVNIHRKAFGDTEILRDIHLDISAGETVALLGPSGVGKTTLLRIVAGLDDKFEGNVRRPDNIAMVFQEPRLLPWRTASDNIMLVTGVHFADALNALEAVGLGEKENHFPGQLSLGQQRRLALARAFSTQPKLLIMDEPFASLDNDRVQEMVELTRRLIDANQTTTLFVTHSESEARELADRIVRIDGKPARLQQR